MLSQKKKKLLMRIIVIVIAVAMFLGIVVGSIVGAFAEDDTVIVESFTTGDLSSAFNEAKGSIDQNNVKAFAVNSGELSAQDLILLQNLSSCKIVNLRETTLQDGIIPDYMMSGRTVSSFSFPSNVTSIGSGAFSGCGNLSDISMPTGLVSVGNRSFESCSSLISVTFPETLVSIDECAFRGSGVKDVYFNGNAPQIASEVFPADSIIHITAEATGFDSDEWSKYSIVADVNQAVPTVISTSETTAAEEISEIGAVSQTTTTGTTSNDLGQILGTIVFFAVIAIGIIIAVVKSKKQNAADGNTKEQ